MRNLEELEKQLAREIADIAISDAVEAALQKEFDRKWGRAVRPGVYVTALAAAIAASLLLVAVWPKPKPHPVVASTISPQPASAEIKVVVPKPATHRRTKRKRPATLPADTEPQFLSIPYSTPLAPYERAEIVRVDLPVSALIAAGFHISTSDPGARAQADVIVGEDGMAHALRLISILSN